MLSLIYGGIIAAAGLIFLTKRIFAEEETDKSGRRKRSMSYASQAMLRGSFPKEANVPQPIISVVLYFAELPTVSAIREVCEEMLYYDRLRSVFVEENNKCSLVEIDIKNINIEKDLIENMEVTSEENILEAVDKIAQNDLELSKPLWRFYRIVSKTGKSALFFRIHHTLGDGISLIGTLSSVLKDVNGTPLTLNIPQKMRGSGNIKFSILQYISSTFSVLFLANTPYDSNLKYTSSEKKKLAYKPNRKTVTLPTLKLDFYKEIKNKAGVTINDVIMAVTTGALRRYCVFMNDPLITLKSNLLSRVLMPVAFPRPISESKSASKGMRNQWAFVSVPLPIDSETPKDRLLRCQAETNALKSSPAAFIQLWIQNNLASFLPEFMQRQLPFDIFSRHSAVLSNVPGPDKIVSFGGQNIVGIKVIFPNIITQINIVSYVEDVSYCISIDPEVIQRYDLLSKFYMEEIIELAKTYNINVKKEDIQSKVFS